MLDILRKVIDYIGTNLYSLLLKIIDTIKSVSSTFDHYLDRKDIKDANKDKNDTKKICDKGTLDDLLNKFLKIWFIVLLFVVGCSTQINITSTKSWEGHYMTTKDFYNSTKDIQLDKKESIWVLSNNTLNRILNDKGNNK